MEILLALIDSDDATLAALTPYKQRVVSHVGVKVTHDQPGNLLTSRRLSENSLTCSD